MVLLPSVSFLACVAGARDRPTAEYDPQTGRLRSFAYDVNGNGRNDAISYFEDGHLQRIELDLDENGKVERWDFYGTSGKLERVGLSQRNDGVMDAEAFYTEAGILTHIRISTRRDGRYDRTEYYENNVLIRSEDDVNGDGKPDKWDTYLRAADATAGAPPYTITTTSIDETGRGAPTRRFTFGEDGTVLRVEAALRGDGVFIPLDPAVERTAPSRGAVRLSPRAASLQPR
jgi:hypothetical protein